MAIPKPASGAPRAASGETSAPQVGNRPGDRPFEPDGNRGVPSIPKHADDPTNPDAARRPQKPLPEEESLPADSWCDPMARSLLQWATPLAPGFSVSPPAHGLPSAVLEQIAGQVVKRVRVGEGAVHLQLGSGRLEGGEVLVKSGIDGLDISVTAPVGVDGAQLGEAIRARLRKRGLRVASVAVE